MSNVVPWPRVRVNSWSQFQHEIEAHLDGEWIFRGVSSVRHELTPSIGRRRNDVTYSPELENSLFKHFKREALPFLSARPLDSWEWLALAQHYGVPTRLLDWSESPYVSLFFAVWGNNEDDAGLYIAPRPALLDDLGNDPFQVSDICFFYPGHVTARLVSQRGLFTVHPRPVDTYVPDGLKQITLGCDIKIDFRRKLDATGIHHAALFPDLDGLSRRLVTLHDRRFAKHAPRPSPSHAAILSETGTALSEGRAALDGVVKRRISPQDPQKGQWGQLSTRNGWSLSAEVTEVSEDWYQIRLTVEDTSHDRRLTSNVTFYLHNSFKEPVRTVHPISGRAKLKVWAYGAFTVGAVVAQDNTPLELDLAKLKDAPKRFRER